MSRLAIITILILLSIMGNEKMVESHDDLTTILSYSCNDQRVPLNDPYMVNVQSLLDGLQGQVAANLPNGVFVWNTDVQGTTAYAFADCDPTKGVIDCVYCLSECTEEFPKLCGTSVGAQIVMKACFMRYEDYRFM